MQGKHQAIIVAGGSGSRMGGNVAKQFMELDNRPVLVHTIEKFLSLSFEVEIILVLPADYKEYWRDYCFNNRLTFRHTLVSGGITRFHSVKNAVKYLSKDTITAVHDGVRPFVTKEFLEEMYREGEERGAVIPVTTPTDSMRIKLKRGLTQITDRDLYYMVQTPQVFRSDILIKAYDQAYSPQFTDDASVVEAMGERVEIAPGLPLNIKLTRPEDMILGKAILSVS